MELITKRGKIDRVADSWREQYWTYAAGWLRESWRSKNKDIHERLKALPQGATEQDVKQIIGNGSWTKVECDECGQDVESVVQFGDDEKVLICADCLRKALALIEKG